MSAWNQDLARRRNFLKASVGAAVTSPLLLKKSAYGAAPNDRIVVGAIGMGGRGRGDLGGFLNFPQVHVVATDKLPWMV